MHAPYGLVEAPRHAIPVGQGEGNRALYDEAQKCGKRRATFEKAQLSGARQARTRTRETQS
jgi:hypothetical protein